MEKMGFEHGSEEAQIYKRPTIRFELSGATAIIHGWKQMSVDGVEKKERKKMVRMEEQSLIKWLMPSSEECGR